MSGPSHSNKPDSARYNPLVRPDSTFLEQNGATSNRQKQGGQSRLVKVAKQLRSDDPKSIFYRLGSKDRKISWKRPFQFAFRPKVIFLFVLPTTLLLEHFDPFGLKPKVSSTVEEIVPTLESEKRKVREEEVIPRAYRDGNSASDQVSRTSIPWDWRKPASTLDPSQPPPPRIVLGLESSADDSCCAIVDGDRRIWSNVVLKQHEQNAVFGGIHSLFAQKLHQRNVPRAIRMALDEAGLKVDDLDAIAYTRGPGMLGSLNVCAMAAKALAAAHDLPLISVHHMQAHALTPLLTEPVPPSYPFLVVLVSGGHTQLVLAKGLNEFKILADCSDAKIGDAFDKVARILQLPPSKTQNSGATLEHYASLPPLPPFDTAPLPKFPIPLSTHSSSQLQFSFSGLISAVERYILSVYPHSTSGNRIQREGSIVVQESYQRAVARSFQVAAFTHLCQKISLVLASPDLDNVAGVVVSGGVASNQALRSQLETTLAKLNKGHKLYYPPISLCTDNAAMIAWTAILRINDGETGDGYDLPSRAKWSIEDVLDKQVEEV